MMTMRVVIEFCHRCGVRVEIDRRTTNHSGRNCRVHKEWHHKRMRRTSTLRALQMYPPQDEPLFRRPSNGLWELCPVELSPNCDLLTAIQMTNGMQRTCSQQFLSIHSDAPPQCWLWKFQRPPTSQKQACCLRKFWGSRVCTTYGVYLPK